MSRGGKTNRAFTFFGACADNFITYRTGSAVLDCIIIIIQYRHSLFLPRIISSGGPENEAKIGVCAMWRERLVAVVRVSRTILKWGWIPLILYLGK